jgi:hypothetical protein
VHAAPARLEPTAEKLEPPAGYHAVAYMGVAGVVAGELACNRPTTLIDRLEVGS